MRVKAARAFHDREAGERREPGVEFDVAADRGAYLVSLRLVTEVEAPKKAAPRKRTAKKAE